MIGAPQAAPSQWKPFEVLGSPHYLKGSSGAYAEKRQHVTALPFLLHRERGTMYDRLARG